MTQEARFWVVIPAAGKGRRMGGTLPKQYLPLAGSTVIEQTLGRFYGMEEVAGIVVAVAAHDQYWCQSVNTPGCQLMVVEGGEERRHSVASALQRLRDQAAPADWVLVHDAVRPCVQRRDIRRLMQVLRDDPVGGVLAIPLSDTLKHVDDGGRITGTLDRRGLWRAVTPQMFRFGILDAALSATLTDGAEVTDEASAVELAGHRPRVVECHPDNIKITHADDLPLAEVILRQILEQE